MRSRIWALAGWLMAAVLALLSAPAPNALADIPVQLPAVHVYDGHHSPAVLVTATIERGPPAAHDTHTTHNAVGAPSHGPSQRHDDTRRGPTTAYANPAEFTQGAPATSTTVGHAQVPDAPAVGFIRSGVAANGGRALTKYDADFALGQITSGGRASASQLDEFGAAQGWIRSQTATGPVKYTDADGIARLTIKRGSPRAPGSGGPHVELRNADGFRVDPYGNLVTRRSVGNHTPIEWDW